MNRPVGPINPEEVKEFQESYFLHIDGKVGNETWGRVRVLEDQNLELVGDIERRIAELRVQKTLVDKLKTQGWRVQFPIGLIVGGLVVYLAGEYLF